MKLFGDLFLIATLSSSVLALSIPETAENEVDQRAKTVTCHVLNETGQMKSYKVNVAHAESEARKAGLAPGKSGDPHRFENREALHFGVYNCDKHGSILLEYPIFRDGEGKNWMKDVPTKEQSATPIRTVFANSHGGFVWCGVMAHEAVNKRGRGRGSFKRCV